MNHNKQLLYFSRLSHLDVDQDILITLADVAEMMFTSPRHCRTLLKGLNELGWIEWTPKVGRNQRSLLRVFFTLEQIKSQIAQQLMSKGDYQKALEVIDNDQALFSQLLKSTSGAQQRDGRLHVQLTYDRTFYPLLPHLPTRNSERFLLRQVYNCLTQCDANGNVHSNLAHYWSYNETKLTWRFYLRPQLHFHDGRAISAKEVVSLFTQLRHLPLYANELDHVESISEINSLCVQFTLNQPDPSFAALVSDIKYSIQPSSQLTNTNQFVGSGVFQVKEHSNKRLTLQAYEGFHGYRALLDTVTIWQLPSKQGNAFGDTQLQAGLTKPTESLASTGLSLETNKGEPNERSPRLKKRRIEDGCLFAMVNHRANLPILQRKSLSQLISSESLLAQLAKSDLAIEAVPAYNLLPSWVKVFPTREQLSIEFTQISIALFEHHALKQCAHAVAQLMQQHGVKCQVNVYSHREFYARALNGDLQEDLILTSINLDDNRPISAFCWMLSNPIIHHALPSENSDWVKARLHAMRRIERSENYLTELESITSALITSHYMIPMFHHKQTLHFEGVLKDVAINVWGWPELREVWAEEE